MIRKAWESLSNRCKTCARTTLFTGAAVAGLIVAGLLLAGGAAGLAWTNTEKFCIGCHEMRENVYAEFEGTIHDKNASGVRAICSDCHVPREPAAMLLRKIGATFEIWGHLTGVIDTKEKFEAQRYELAKRVWKRMKETDSLECRNCHKDASMSTELQSEKAQNRHAKGKAEGKTCIDCHYAIAHDEPDGPGPQELEIAKNKR
ncbi:MAG: NapC/NirT family cytochrome c [Betaproteobacteria bacterium]